MPIAYAEEPGFLKAYDRYRVPHSCHTFTTRMCEAGVNIKAMQSVLAEKTKTSVAFYISLLKG
jgi:hypothetical protein